MHLRTLPDAHLDAFSERINYAFRPTEGPNWDRDEEDHPDLFTPFGFYETPPEATPEASDLTAVCGTYDFTVRVRGEWHRMPGLAAVASPPETRRRGIVARMLDSLLERHRENDVALSTLWPFEYPFYRRFGWATANNYARLTVPPEQLSAVAADPAGSFRRLSADEDLDAIRAVHESWATESLAVKRTEGWWRDAVFGGEEPDSFVYGWEDDAGRLRGYVVYEFEEREDGDGRRLNVRELAAADEEAAAHLRRFCRDHDSQVEEVRFARLPEWARPIDAYPDPRAATLEIRPGPMVRIVDVASALTDVSYDAEESVTLDVRDDRCEWNDAAFRLDVTDGDATCRRIEDGGDADCEVEIGALSQLLVGARTVEEVVRAGDASAGGEAARTLERLFPRERTFLREQF
ncbi:GNAT family N-acetyltransferase [Halopelagius longus]|uniref:GNAT family N-acetyltransferase n=1 Tax=Halopelagius longus TaxID=1236180 RepID=A0A1H0YA96_9EURY|nr:GNAT family N-acetyltransferase [Halopelagius longus]RDI72377.1 GNAT family N-acetyltransferase [Halopelagius longus]SDQ12105.1 Predicted acetyltransferase [Halopelagius longus]